MALVEDDCLETDVGSTSTGMDAVDRLAALRVASVVTVPVLVRYRVNVSTALVPHLKLRHLQWLVSIQSVGDRIYKCRRCYTSRLRDSCCYRPKTGTAIPA